MKSIKITRKITPKELKTNSDKSGYYEFKNLRNGQYDVRLISAQGYYNERDKSKYLSRNIQTYTIPVKGRNLSEINFLLSKSVSIRGRVFDPEENFLSGAIVGYTMVRSINERVETGCRVSGKIYIVLIIVFYVES